jgi:hypothetical protein
LEGLQLALLSSSLPLFLFVSLLFTNFLNHQPPSSLTTHLTPQWQPNSPTKSSSLPGKPSPPTGTKPDGNKYWRTLQEPCLGRFLNGHLTKPGCRALDLATGNGLCARWLAERGAKVTATDGSEKMVEITKGRCAGWEGIEVELLDVVGGWEGWLGREVSFRSCLFAQGEGTLGKYTLTRNRARGNTTLSSSTWPSWTFPILNPSQTRCRSC